MIKIYCGRENLNKEEFMYDQIAKTGNKAIVLVPDQYTLEGEKQAFEYLQTDGLMDVQIMAFSRLGDKLLNKFGGSGLDYINDYGRHIILTKVMKDLENNGQLEVYAGQARKQSFVELVQKFIGDVKKYQGTIDVLEKIIEGVDDNILKQKLGELYLIAQEYEEAIKGKYTDSDDKINQVLEKIKLSDKIKQSSVWVYGFDTLTPNYMRIISELASNAKNVNIVLTYDEKCNQADVFKATKKTIRDFDLLAEEYGHQIERIQIENSYEKKYLNDDVSKVEQMYAQNLKQISGGENLNLVKSSNAYSEAETAACYVLKLLKEKKYRMNDIVIVCNDPDKGASIIDRVFQEYGIKIFLDKKRNLIESNIIVFVLALINSIKNNYRTKDILETLKCGFMDLTDDEVEDLENYVFKYRIKGNMWKQPFKFGEKEYKTEKFAQINALRKKVYDKLEKLENITKNATSNKNFIENFYQYLKDEIDLPTKIEKIKNQQEQMGRRGREFAEVTAQVWNSFVSILEQVATLSDSEEFEISQFVDMLQVGLASVEIGMVPPTIDGITLVTTQRSRISKAKAVLVLSANEGILPLRAEDDVLFSNDEQEIFAKLGGQITKLDTLMNDEENLAIYRILSLPTENIFISSCLSDVAGEVMLESPVFTQIKETFASVEIHKDILNSENDEDMVLGGKISNLRHLSEKLTDKNTSSLTPVWSSTLDYYRNTPEFNTIMEGFSFTNKQRNIGEERCNELYGQNEQGQLIVSPTRLEKFSRCPFAHFLQYGLKLDERRVFEASRMEIGTLYHEVIMRFSQELSKDGFRSMDPQSKWQTITTEEISDLIEKLVIEVLENEKESVFKAGKAEEYKIKRLVENCKYAAWALVAQARAGTIERSEFESQFKENGKIRPIQVHTDSGDVFVEGKIDRVDYLPGNRVKIIDYKTGLETFDKNEVEKGYRLQLMLYLKAAKEEKLKTAGVFYFIIKQPEVQLDEKELDDEGLKEKIGKEVFKSFKMNGALVNDLDVINSIDRCPEGRFSQVVPVQFVTLKGEDGKPVIVDGEKVYVAKESASVLSQEDFDELEKTFDNKIAEICKKLREGNIDIAPMKVRNGASTCKYCKYKGICRFDEVFPGNRYVWI